MEKVQRYMKPEDWHEEKVVRVPHLNSTCVPSGYNRNDGVCGNPLLPACVFEDKLDKIIEYSEDKYSAISIKRYHIRMPYWNRGEIDLPTLYSFIPKPERLVSSSVTIATVKKESLENNNCELMFAYDKKELKSLKSRINTGNIQSSLIGNLGYYMTENLIEGILPWTHNKRYSSEYHLKTVMSYLGFYYYEENNKIHSNFMGAHPACVCIKKNNEIEIVPHINIEKYKIKIDDVKFEINSINPIITEGDVSVFTPEYRSDNDAEYLYKLSEFAPMIPVEKNEKRVNVFVANEGNGKMPFSKIIKIWNENAPIPSFGAVISFSEKYYKKLFNDKDILNSEIDILPIAIGFDFEKYSQILGGFVPAAAAGKLLYDVKSVDDLIVAMDKHGNAMSPLAQVGRETRNFDAYIREPAGLLVETENTIGWILFDGRHELTIGVSIADVVKILKLIETENILGSNIKNAVFIDGGSAMKAYITEMEELNGIKEINLKLLNRVAAGARNGPGDDPEGLNLYSTLSLPIV